ncbi:hypothetical protein K435DRAFT_778117 [Dendrothele bispora CBS 962.96]|uniref:Uncharacterized protein n=1 Tax=Dendrothele bispora (strain CBS 962.96) TaxID=1314807 RepID=A0A4S8M526_DENBC|nr:hypothetical protein K435DRAFT_778117 [Dendrothele bispora CBS 962.96]
MPHQLRLPPHLSISVLFADFLVSLTFTRNLCVFFVSFSLRSLQLSFSFSLFTSISFPSQVLVKSFSFWNLDP